MKAKINLEKILKQYSNICIDDYEDVFIAMKEACRQSLELAAEKAEVDYDDFDYATQCWNIIEINKQSILDVINLIE